MKVLIPLALAVFALSTAQMLAQSDPGTADSPRPAASSATKSPDTTGMAPNRSGSGTSTSGGSDANGDQGRDAMPESNKTVKPLDEGLLRSVVRSNRGARQKRRMRGLKAVAATFARRIVCHDGKATRRC